MYRVTALSRAVFAACLAASVSFLSNQTAQAQGGDRPYSWTGFYVGANIGYGWGDVSVRDTNGGVLPGPFEYDTRGLLGGIQVGYNKQFDSLVAGLEIEGGYLGATNGEFRIPSSLPPNFQRLWVDSGLYGIIAARLGIAIQSRTLLYGKAGAIWFDGEAGQKTTRPGYVTHMADGFNGWAYGGGVEHMLQGGWSVKLEYMRLDFGTVTGDQENVGDNSSPIGFKFINKHDFAVDTVKLGINYRF